MLGLVHNPAVTVAYKSYWLLIAKVLIEMFLHFAEADYTLDDSFWNEESPVGK